MTNDKHDPSFEETKLAAGGHATHSALPDDHKKSGDSTDQAICCTGMSCRKKIILAATAALVLLAIILTCSGWCRKCKCGDREN